MLKQVLGVVLVVPIVLCSQAQGHAQSSSSTSKPNPLIREEEKIAVNGNPETWRLEWESTPEDSPCGPNEPDGAMTCPCGGFAYAEQGQLDLVRVRNSTEIERLKLTPLFEKNLVDQHGAMLQKWPLEENDYKDYSKDFGAERFAQRVRLRPVAKVMQFADYNHDGNATEFFLQTGAAPCSKIFGVIVGVNRSNQRLHVFGSIANPNRPLVLQKAEWEALLRTTRPVELLDWKCGDHGSGREIHVALNIQKGNIRAIRRIFECMDDGKPGRLLEEKPF
jgi:hypothetical protein